MSELADERAARIALAKELVTEHRWPITFDSPDIVQALLAEIERLRAIEAVAQALCDELPGVKWLRHLRAALAQPKEER